MKNKLLRTTKKRTRCLIKNQLLFCMFVLISVLPFQSYSQDLASLSSIPESPQSISENSLADLLNNISQTYHVQFAYDSRLIDNLSVKTTEVEPNKKVNVVLENALSHTDLSFEKVKKDQYVIFRNPSQKKEAIKELKGKKIAQSYAGQTLAASTGINSNFAQEVHELYQTISITGKILDENSNPLPGVNVLVASSATGTVSDINGDYSLEVPAGTEGLTFSFIGYVTEQVLINNRSVINFTMTADIKQLSEVVVTALGIEKDQKTLGYATAKVDPDEFNVNRTPNFMDALQGKVAGVNITKMGSGPQGSSKIRIRGVSSFGNNNSPLIVINGVPIDNTNFGVSGDIGEVGSNRKSDSGDGLSSVNPDDVTSMTVLKGAAASALYGSRAKDGVIMITTKNRSDGNGVQVSYNMNYTNGTPLDYTDYQYEYGQGEGGVRPNAPGPSSGVWSFGEKMGGTQILFDGITAPYEPTPGKIRDYYNNSSTFMNTVTISSGGDNGGVSLSASNMDAKAILPGSDYNRTTINLGFTQKLKKLTVAGNVNYSYEKRVNPPNIAEQDFSPVVIYTLASSMPMDLLEENCCDALGNEIRYSRFTNRTNPYFALKRFENNERDRVYGNVSAKYDFTDWLFIQGRVGMDFYSRAVDYNLPTGSQRQSSPPPGFVNGQYIQDNRRTREVNADFLIGFDKKFGDIGVVANFGGNQMYRRADVNTILGENFFTRDLYTIGNASKVSPNYSLSERKVNSLYGSAEVSFREFLYVNGTLRNDWFSTLSADNRSILYPSITGSFVFSQAFQNLPDWISFGKLRVAYAEVGSDTDVAPYSNNLFYSISTQQLLNQPVGNVSSSTIPNPSLRPMSVTEKEIGLELTLFRDFRFEISYYDKLSSDQILTAQISDGSGYTTQLINVGESQNRGVEMFGSISPIQKDNFEWFISANASYNTSKVLSLGDDVDGTFITVGNAEFHGEVRQVVGQPMAQLYGWGYLRNAQGQQVFDPANGRPLRSTEQLAFGSALPTWYGGITNGFTIFGVTASFLIDFKLGHYMISGTHTNAYRHGLDKATLVGRDVGYVIGDGVNPDGNVNTTQTAIQPFYETIRSGRMSEQSVFDAGSWQLRQITIGYDFTKFLKSTKVVKGVKLDFVANNVAVISTDVPHIHPDQNGIIGDNRVGLEATGLPVTRDIGFNLNVKF